MGEAAKRRAMRAEKQPRVLLEDASGILIDHEDGEDIYVDGVGQLTIGSAITKIRFYKVFFLEHKNNSPYEHREVVQSVIIPTSSLFAWLLNFGPMLANSVGIVEGGSNTTIEMMKKFAENFKEPAK